MITKDPKIRAAPGVLQLKKDSSGGITIFYPRPTPPSSSSSKPPVGKDLFNDVYDQVQLFSAAFLFANNATCCLLGLTIGALKPLVDYKIHHVQAKKLLANSNQGDLGHLIALDTENEEYNAGQRDPTKHKGEDVTGGLSYLILKALPLYIISALHENHAPSSFTLTALFSARIGFEWGQRAVKYVYS